jgi:hypothetical protein
MAYKSHKKTPLSHRYLLKVLFGMLNVAHNLLDTGSSFSPYVYKKENIIMHPLFR